jgi:beta-N-acetylglucosaminidase
VSASEDAVAYYLDPRNFLNEEYIFQFESTLYDESQTQDAVETIIRNTWMYNSYITYLDASGNSLSYTENGQPIKYSEAIMKAAKDSGMSAYYLASKIVQEVGSTTSSSAGGSSGKCSPYNGIYNYYNIGAYTGALDGLSWANGYMKTSSSTTLYKSAGETTLCTVPSDNTLYFMGEAGNFYKVKTTVSGTSYTGYVSKSAVSISTSYGRPWDNPYKSIYYGAKYIYSGFSEYQFTNYLQKFNN